MFNQISWQQYLSFLVIILFVYYLFIWIVYYKGKLPSFVRVRNAKKSSFMGEDQPDEAMSNSQHVIDEIKNIFPGRQNKNELLYSLQSKLKKYIHWDETGFREIINEFILSESKRQCSIHLSEEDLRVLWL